MLIAEHDIGLYLQIGTAVVVALIIPGIIKVIIKFTQLEAKMNNGISHDVRSLRREVIAQREEYAERMHKLEIDVNTLKVVLKIQQRGLDPEGSGLIS